jgi:serine kinase of HPr protein (carbohydrate metabolism regulator)
VSEPSSENLHASTVAWNGRAILISGPSGAGKSDLALRLIDRGFVLVSDDQTAVRREGQQLLATAPPTIAGKLEVRGFGIVEMETAANVPVALMVELATEVQRMPEENCERSLLGVRLPLVRINSMAPSAAAKIVLALDRFGLRF